MFNNIFGWTNDKEGHNSDWAENDNDDELFHHLMQQSEDMFKNFEKLIEGFGYQDFNQLNEFPIYSYIGQNDGAQNNKDSQYKYSLRDSLLKDTQDKRDVVEKNFNHKVDMPQIFSSAFQYSDIFGSSAGNAVFEKKIRTKGPDGVEKIIISRGVGDQVEETVITKDRQGNIISQESTTNKFDKSKLLKIQL